MIKSQRTSTLRPTSHLKGAAARDVVGYLLIFIAIVWFLLIIKDARTDAVKHNAAVAEAKAAADWKIIEAAIRKELKKPEGELTKADLEKITHLHLASNKLTELPKGLENLTQLTELNLMGNQLTSVKGLEKLNQLKKLRLIRNKLTDLTGLENLTQLTLLHLGKNQLTDVSALENLTQLKVLDLWSNQLTEVPKGLEKLTQLTYLRLLDNLDLTKAQIDQLQKALPKCKIRHPNGVIIPPRESP